MKKEKKYNYYNLLVYLFKIFSVISLLILIPWGLSEYDILPKELSEFFGISCVVNGVIALTCLFLTDKFGKKITIPIEKEKPKNPYIYHLKSENFEMILKDMQDTLETMKYEVEEKNNISSKVYFYNKENIFSKVSQITLFSFYEYEELTKEGLKNIQKEKKAIGNAFKTKKNYEQIILIVKIKNENEFLSEYLRKRTAEYFYRYILIGFLVESDKRLYIPRAEAWVMEHYKMRKKVLKTLQNHLEEKK